MNDEQLQTLEQVNQFLEGSEALEFSGLITEEKYRFPRKVIDKFFQKICTYLKFYN